jgi:hypothetical protein
MAPKRLLVIMPILFNMFCLTSCSDIIEPAISKSTVTLEAPVSQYQSISYSVGFWWDEVDHALSYHLQVVTPDFTHPGKLVLDTAIKKILSHIILIPVHTHGRSWQKTAVRPQPLVTPGFVVEDLSIK